MTAGPGLTNTVTAVKNAQMAESPLLLMGGAAGTLLQVGSERERGVFKMAANGALSLTFSVHHLRLLCGTG